MDLHQQVWWYFAKVQIQTMVYVCLLKDNQMSGIMGYHKVGLHSTTKYLKFQYEGFRPKNKYSGTFRSSSVYNNTKRVYVRNAQKLQISTIPIKIGCIIAIKSQRQCQGHDSSPPPFSYIATGLKYVLTSSVALGLAYLPSPINPHYLVRSNHFHNTSPVERGVSRIAFAISLMDDLLLSSTLAAKSNINLGGYC